MGFVTDFGMSVGAGTHKVDSDFVKEQDEAAARSIGIWMNCVRHRVGSMLWHTIGPGMLALAASSERSDVETCAGRVVKDFLVFKKAQNNAANKLFLTKFVRANPHQIAIMEDVAYLMIAPDHHYDAWRFGKLVLYARNIYLKDGGKQRS